MTTPWTEYMRRRVKHEEKNIPWWVNNKVTLNDFCVDHEILAPQIFERWDHPSKIDFSQLPEVFVLKPNLMSSSRGVMVIRVQADGTYFDSLKGRTLTFGDILTEQTKLFEEAKYKKSYRIFAEEVVLDAKDPTKIPLDYKIYCFYDKPVLVQQIDRNSKPTSTSFFDRNFEKMDIEGKITSSWKHYQLGPVAPPATANQMLSIAGRLTQAIETPFMRVDMYNSTRGPLVGELTPAPGGPYHGILYKFTDEYDQELGREWEAALERISADKKAAEGKTRF